MTDLTNKLYWEFKIPLAKELLSHPNPAVVNHNKQFLYRIYNGTINNTSFTACNQPIANRHQYQAQLNKMSCASNRVGSIGERPDKRQRAGNDVYSRKQITGIF